MGHLGLLPQSVNQIGGYRKQATRPAEADALLADARMLEEAGAFAVVLESIPSDVAGAVTAAVSIPTIGIGAGPDCDGQVLVSYDMLGLFDGFVPSFVKQYARLVGDRSSRQRGLMSTKCATSQFPSSPTSVADVPRSGR